MAKPEPERDMAIYGSLYSHDPKPGYPDRWTCERNGVTVYRDYFLRWHATVLRPEGLTSRAEGSTAPAAIRQVL